MSETNSQADFSRLLIKFKDVPKQRISKTFMEIAGYSHYENVCSNILKFYLNPHEEHELGPLVLNALIGAAKGSMEQVDWKTTEIIREYQTLNNNRLDLCITTTSHVIGIENKVFHHLHNDLIDYNNTIKAKCKENQQPICIILSLNKLTGHNDINKAKQSNFTNITYQQLFSNIKDTIGKHTTTQNISYVTHLTDFIKSIENLTPKTMENKALWSFFKDNNESIKELISSFNDYGHYLHRKSYLLQEIIPKEKYAPSADKQWNYKDFCLVHDYTIKDRFKISIDAYIRTNGWKIELFGRNNESSDYLFNIMCQENNFLPKPLDSYERDQRIVYQRFDTETELSTVADTITDLLSRLERYKQNHDLQPTSSVLNMPA